MSDPNETPQVPESKPDAGGAPIGEVNKDARTMGMLAHLLGILTSFVGPLVIYLMKKDDNPFVAQEAKEALNFQLTILILYVAATVIAGLTCILFFLPLVPFVLAIVFGIMGTMSANNGNPYRYPFCIRMIS